MTTKVKPIFLLSDSHLLFWQQDEAVFVDRLRKLLEEGEETPQSMESVKAAYIGASNDDNPDFYDIFIAAMQQIDLKDCRLIPSQPGDDDIAYLETADLILLAGGDTEKGWNIIEDKFQKIIVDRYYNGALLVGISAGAVQLGLKGWKETGSRKDNMFDTFQLVPAVIDVHDEENDWEELREMVEHLGGYTRGFGIPMGGAAVYHPDWSFEAVRHHLVEFSHVEKEFKRSLIIPSVPGEDGEAANDEEEGYQRRIVSPDDILNSGIDLPPMMDIDVEAQPVD